jgi:DNA-binding GntR family transcriptional regulator
LIFSGSVRPGDYLRLEPIAEAVGVSNTPVREGLLMLRSEGLVRLVPRRGFAVEPFTPQDVHDIFWVQAHLAGELAARAAKRITPAEIALLEEISAHYRIAAASNDEAGIGRFGHAFHRTINKAAGSPRLARLLGAVVQNLPNRFYATIEQAASETPHDHDEILEALKAGNARKSRKLVEDHILERSDHLVTFLRGRNLWEDAV